MTDSRSMRTRTKAIPTDYPHNSLEVIWSADGKTILSDRRIKIMDSNQKNKVTATRS